MARSFHYKIESTDDCGVSRICEFVVIARDEAEAIAELSEVFELHDVIETWRVTELLRAEDLADDDVYAIDYAAKGAHSYFDAI